MLLRVYVTVCCYIFLTDTQAPPYLLCIWQIHLHNSPTSSAFLRERVLESTYSIYVESYTALLRLYSTSLPLHQGEADSDGPYCGWGSVRVTRGSTLVPAGVLSTRNSVTPWTNAASKGMRFLAVSMTRKSNLQNKT